MKIIDISQEVFSSVVYPGDPSPKREMLSEIKNGAPCNLTAFSMCAHNGTHIDAPYHFIENGEKVDALSLEKTVGYAFVKHLSGDVTESMAQALLEEARKENPEAAKRILVGGRATLTLSAAELFAREGILLFGNESQSVGPEGAPMAVHKALLSQGVALLEGIRLNEVEDGVYFLFAAPLKLGGADGAPVRAILMG